MKELPAYPEERLDAFLIELTALAMRFRLGITGEPVLFVMERDDDEREYRVDDASNLTFQ